MLTFMHTLCCTTAQVRRPQAAALEVPIAQLSDADRAAYAKEIGYETVGKDLPDGVTLTDIVKTMPPEVRKGLGSRHRTQLGAPCHPGRPHCCSQLRWLLAVALYERRPTPECGPRPGFTPRPQPPPASSLPHSNRRHT